MIKMLENLKTILSEKFNIDPDDVTMDSNFKSDFGLDSLDLFELLMALEEEMDFEVDTEAIAGITTVGDVVRYLEEIGA